MQRFVDFICQNSHGDRDNAEGEDGLAGWHKMSESLES